MKIEAPTNWLKTIENIRMVRQKFPAPVDTMGCDQAHTRTDKDVDQRFQVLVSLMLSSQTKDPITWQAVQNLKEKGMGNVAGILGAKEKDIEDTIYPVGFYRRKAIYLKKVAEILKKDYDGDIPDSIEALCNLPGVGPKMAHLCMLEAWNIVSGIGVDTHVHRISARLGWVPAKGIKTPEDTRKYLESWLPQDYWREINHLLVGFGQTICTPTWPKCDQCYNNTICPSANSYKNASAGKKTIKKADTKLEPEVMVKLEAEVQPEPESEPDAKSKLKKKSEPKAKLEPKVKSEIRETKEIKKDSPVKPRRTTRSSKRTL